MKTNEAAYPASDLMKWVGGECVNQDRLGQSLDRIRITRASRLSDSGPDSVAFFFSRHYESELPAARAGVLLTGLPFVAPLLASGLPWLQTTAVIACDDPYMGMAHVLKKLSYGVSATLAPLPEAGRAHDAEIHSSAVVDPTATIGARVKIGPNAVIEADAVVGDGATIFAGTYVGRGTQIGDDTVLFANVTVYERCILGARVRVHSGTVIGADGFGYAPEARSDRTIVHHKIYHLGRVVIGDDVEIGANTCIDRGTVGDTRIDRFAKIDNLVQIAHNCEVGEGAVICGSAGMSGSSSLGRYAYVGGAAGLKNQIHVGDGAKIGAMSLVAKDVAPDEVMIGNPLRTYNDYFRIQATLSRMIKKKPPRNSEIQE